jgi:DNA-binding NarL/FixJ family response regulator
VASTLERRTRVLIADDRPGARAGLRVLLATRPEIELVGEAADGQEALELVERYHPDVVLLDVRMPHLDGIQATRRIKENWPEARVVLLSMYAAYRPEAMAAGADRFLVKGGPITQVFEAILEPWQS